MGGEVRAGAVAAQVAAALLCKLAGAYLPHTIVHITYSLDALLPFGDQRPHLGRRAFGAVGRHISIDWWQHLPSTNHPPAHPQLPHSPNNSDAQIPYCQGVLT